MVRGEAFLSFERGPRPDIHTYTVWVRHFLLVACILCRFESAFCPFFLCYHTTVAVNSVGSTLLYIYCIWGIEYGVTVKTSFLNLSRRADSNHVQYSYHTTMKKNDIFLYSFFQFLVFKKKKMATLYSIAYLHCILASLISRTEQRKTHRRAL